MEDDDGKEHDDELDENATLPVDAVVDEFISLSFSLQVPSSDDQSSLESIYCPFALDHNDHPFNASMGRCFNNICTKTFKRF